MHVRLFFEEAAAAAVLDGVAAIDVNSGGFGTVPEWYRQRFSPISVLVSHGRPAGQVRVFPLLGSVLCDADPLGLTDSPV
jgi:hypothetical protein